ncbi:MAG TPA: 5'-nucleotidase, lipoprotein e(P4) family [Chitinophaga sp.]|uniref:5'-nucleotidase, lipoprotein e(P4) family n=1 Tax=Chitinophaga sp. TaxID=1869181 RepID=UPI002F95EC2F
MHKKTIFITFIIVLTLACKAPQPAIVQSPRTALLPYGAAWAALWQQRSAEYKALCFQAYNTATQRLNEYVQQSTDKPFAIVTDIDETVLDNSPYTVHTALTGQVYSDKTWQEWTAKAACDTVPGALAFLKYAAAKGVRVFYITNRAENERAATLQNLQRWNFPDADDQHLLLKASSSSKETRRLQVAQTHNIIMLLGDNLGDFAALFEKQSYAQRELNTENAAASFGSRFIVLPNPMYGDWLGTLINFQYQLSPQQQDSLLKSQLINY